MVDRLPVGWLQADLTGPPADAVRDLAKQLPAAVLAPRTDPPDPPHVTVRWGLVAPDPDVIRALVVGTGSLVIHFREDVRRFVGHRVDVVYVGARCPGLAVVHRRVGLSVPHIDSVWAYAPHATVAHTRPECRGDGTYSRLAMPPGRARVATVDTLTLCMPDGSRHAIPLTPERPQT